MKYLTPLPLLALLINCTGKNYTISKDLTYKVADGIQLTGDLYIPKGHDPKPTVLVVHGGGWSKRSGDMSRICSKLADAGFAVFNVNYRLSPKSLYPKAVDDIRDAVEWLRANSAKYNIDPQNLGAWGYSAGAHLVLLVGLDPNLKLKAIIAGSAPADLTAWPKSPLVNGFLGSEFIHAPELWQQASPVNHVASESPPVFLYHGKWDRLVEYEQMEKMRDALQAKNRVVETYTYSYLGHIAVYVFGFGAVEEGVLFLNKYLRSK